MCSTPTKIDTRYQITIEQDVAWGRRRPARTLVWGRGRPARTAPGYALSRVDFLKEMRDFLHSGALLPLTPLLARVEFLGEMSNVLHSRAPLPLIPPTPFSHKVQGRTENMCDTNLGQHHNAVDLPKIRPSPAVQERGRG
jgi:hypothetical protein